MIVSVPIFVTVQNTVTLSPGSVLTVGLDVLKFSITISGAFASLVTVMGRTAMLLVSSLSTTSWPSSPITMKYHVPGAVPAETPAGIGAIRTILSPGAKSSSCCTTPRNKSEMSGIGSGDR